MLERCKKRCFEKGEKYVNFMDLISVLSKEKDMESVNKNFLFLRFVGWVEYNQKM